MADNIFVGESITLSAKASGALPETCEFRVRQPGSADLDTVAAAVDGQTATARYDVTEAGTHTYALWAGVAPGAVSISERTFVARRPVTAAPA